MNLPCHLLRYTGSKINYSLAGQEHSIALFVTRHGCEIFLLFSVAICT